MKLGGIELKATWLTCILSTICAITTSILSLIPTTNIVIAHQYPQSTFLNFSASTPLSLPESSPLIVDLSISSLPTINVPVMITATTSSTYYVENTTVQIELPSGAYLTNGILGWAGNLQPGISEQISAEIVFSEIGKWQIEVKVDGWLDSLIHTANQDAIYVNLGNETSSFGWSPTPPTVTMMTESGKEISTDYQPDQTADYESLKDEWKKIPETQSISEDYSLLETDNQIMSSTGTSTIYGYYKYYTTPWQNHEYGELRTGNPNILVPARYFLVELRAGDGTFLGSTYTNDYGFYYFTGIDPTGGVKTRIWTYSAWEDDELRVIYSGESTTGLENVYFTLFTPTYTFPNDGLSYSMDVGVVEQDSPILGAWWILDDLIRAYRSIFPWSTTTPGSATARWSDTSTEDTGASGNFITMNAYTATASCTVIHEYAHAIQHNRAPMQYYEYIDPHQVFLLTNPQQAWVEGWAEFFPLMVNNNPLYTNMYTETYDLEECSRYDTYWPSGVEVEGRVAGAIYDLLDSELDNTPINYDCFSTPFSNIWDAFLTRDGSGNTNQTFMDFWEKLNDLISPVSEAGRSTFQNTIIVPEVVFNLTVLNSTFGTAYAIQSGPYSLNQPVSIVATPNTGHAFQEWDGDINGISNIYEPNTSISMTSNPGDRTIYPIFKHYLTIELSPTNGGSIVYPTGSQPFGPYNNNLLKEISVNVNPGYTFTGWQGGNIISQRDQPSTYIRMDNTYTICATFTPTSGPSVTTNVASNITNNSVTLNGTLISLGNESIVSTSFEWGINTSYGNFVSGVPSSLSSPNSSFSAAIGSLQPNTTYHFKAKVIGTQTADGNDMTFTTTGGGGGSTYNLTITTNTPDGAGGSVTSPGTGTFTYSAGQIVTLNASPNTNWHFGNWSGDTGTIANTTSASTTITMNGNYSIMANFGPNTLFYLTVSSSSGGTITYPGIGTFGPYNPGYVYQLYAVPNSGYHFTSWTGDIGTISNRYTASTPITINGNYSIKANFALNGTGSCAVDVQTSTGGTVTNPGVGTYLYNAGQPFNITAVANPGYHFLYWQSTPTGIVSNPYEMNTTATVTTNSNISAYFDVNGQASTMVFVANGPGSETSIDTQYPSSGQHWDKVDDTSSLGDGDTTYIENKNGPVGGYQRDLFSIGNHSWQEGPISAFCIIAVCKTNGTIPKVCVRTHGVVYETSAHCFDTQGVYSQEGDWWNVNPYTGNPWTWAEVDEAEIGVVLAGSTASPDFSRCTQIRAQINYTFDDSRTLAISSSSGGTAAIPGTGTYNYNNGQLVNIFATPDPNYHFVNWSGDTSTIPNPNTTSTTITMNSNHSIQANFTLDTHSLTTTASNGGTVNTPGIGAFGPYNHGQVVNLVATPNANYHFVNWTGDIGAITDPYSANTTITINGNYAIQANFATDTFQLTLSSNPGGIIINPGNGSFGPYNVGQVVNLNVVPDSNYRFVEWIGDTSTIADVHSATTTITMNSDCIIQALFEPSVFTLAVTSGNGGIVANPGIGSFGPYDPNQTINLVAVPVANYHFVNWSGDTISIADPNSSSTTLTMNGNYTIKANFAIDTHMLSVTSDSGGFIANPGIGSFGPFNHGQTVPLLAIANGENSFINWTGDISTISNPNSANTSITINGVYSIHANFSVFISPSVITESTSDITFNSATLNGNLTNKGTASTVTVSFEYGLTTSYGSTTTGIPMSSTGNFNSGISSLSPGTTYHFRAKAVGDGTSYGNDQTFTTTVLTPPSVTTNAATGITSNSATLNGNLTSKGTAGTITVSFEYGLTTSYGSTTTGIPMSSTGNFNSGISSLSPGTTYHFRAKAVGDGTSYGDDQSFTTLSTVVVTRVPNNVLDSNTGGFTTAPLWSKVDETTPNDSDYIVAKTNSGGRCTFGFDAFSIPSGATISQVKVYYRAKDASSGINNIRACLKVGGIYYGTNDLGVDPGSAFNTYSYTFNINPKSSGAWTVNDINGIGSNALQAFGVNGTDYNPDIRVSMIYIEVTYTTGG
jgi:hypothetical protein